MEDLQRQYVESNFKKFLVSDDGVEKVYQVKKEESFETFKVYKHLHTYYISGVIKDIKIFSDKKMHIVEFKI